jgi:hypothetical protein
MRCGSPGERAGEARAPGGGGTDLSAETSEGPATWGLLHESTYKKASFPSGTLLMLTPEEFTVAA